MIDIEQTRSRMEELFSEGQLKSKDIDSAYEALFLRAVTSFEVFLEDLFIAILERKARYGGGRVSVMMKVDSKETLLAIIHQEQKYLNWLPYTHTEKRAKMYLKEGKPFSEIGDGEKSTIKTIGTIRNAIAHRSKHAMLEFDRTVIGSQNLLPSEKTPAGYLRSLLSSGSMTNRFSIYIGELGRVASLLC